MKIINSVEEMQRLALEQKRAGKSIGFVPTMGYLHDGHKSLMEAARKNTDFAILSIFVNPIQFGPGEDYETYPRDEERDLALAGEVGMDAVFLPTPQTMYPKGFSSKVHVEDLGNYLCGQSRPVHFDGVTTVVNKLFNITQADKVYFGQKDAQQLLIIKRMVKDLNMAVEVNGVPTVRETDGLAISSRNVYLTDEERKEGVTLSKSLNLAKAMIEAGERCSDKIKAAMAGMINSETSGVIDYIEVVDQDTIAPVDNIQGDILIAMAVKFSKARLIDNIMLTV